MSLRFTKEELEMIGRRIQDARIAKRLTQETVAQYCNCTAKHISDIERGVVGPSFPVIAKMGKLFDTGVDYYLYGSADYCSDRMISADISESLKDCKTETRLACRSLIEIVTALEKNLGKATLEAYEKELRKNR